MNYGRSSNGWNVAKGAFVFAIGHCLLVPGCAVTEVGLQPVAEDVKIGREYSAKVEEQVGVVRDPQLSAYLQDLVKRLDRQVLDDRFDYQIAVLDQPEPNAFALPGGRVYVSRGLLAIATSEDELAGSIGHEMTHVYRRHTARQLAKERVAAPFKLPGAVVGRVISQDLGRLLNMPANLFGGAFLRAFSRTDELEADRGGLAAAAGAGYDPRAMGALLQRMDRQGELMTGKRRRPSFFDTHPMTPTRVREIDRQAAVTPRSTRPKLLASNEAFYRKIDGLMLGENPAHGVIKEQRFLHPTLDFGIQFPSNWEVSNSPQAVGAVANSRDGLMFLGALDRRADPEALAKSFVASLQKEFGQPPVEDKAVEIGNWPGHLVKMRDDSGSEPVGMYFLWVAGDKATFQLLALASERHEEVMKKAVLSLAPLRGADRSSIEVTRLRIVEAREGETLEQLSVRSGNVWSPRMTGLMNNLDLNRGLKAGTLVKIAQTVPYDSSGNRSASR